MKTLFKMEVQVGEAGGRLIYGNPSKAGGVVIEDYAHETPEQLSQLAVSKTQAALGLDVTADSSVIKSFTYDGNFRELDIQLNSGKTYRYMNVGSSAASLFMHAKSKGQAYNDYIKGRYSVVRIS